MSEGSVLDLSGREPKLLRRPLFQGIASPHHLRIIGWAVDQDYDSPYRVPRQPIFPALSSLLLDLSPAARQFLRSPLPDLTSCEFVLDFPINDGPYRVYSNLDHSRSSPTL